MLTILKEKPPEVKKIPLECASDYDTKSIEEVDSPPVMTCPAAAIVRRYLIEL